MFLICALFIWLELLEYTTQKNVLNLFEQFYQNGVSESIISLAGSTFSIFSAFFFFDTFCFFFVDMAISLISSWWWLNRGKHGFMKVIASMVGIVFSASSSWSSKIILVFWSWIWVFFYDCMDCKIIAKNNWKYIAMKAINRLV